MSFAKMIDLKHPNWVRPITTGIVGIGFRVTKDYDLAILTNGEGSMPSNSDDWLGFWVMRQGQRDIAAEEKLLAHNRDAGLVQTQPFGPGKVLTIPANKLADLFDLAKHVFDSSERKKRA